MNTYKMYFLFILVFIFTLVENLINKNSGHIEFNILLIFTYYPKNFNYTF